MAQLPVYDNPQVRAQPAQGGALNLQAPNLGEAVGQGLMRTGQIMQEVQFQADHLASEDAANKLQEFQVQRLGQFYSLKGENAIKPDQDSGLSPMDQATQDIKDYQRQLSGSLGSGAQKLFKLKTDPHITQFEAQAQNHTMQELDNYATNTLIGKRDVSMQAVALDPQNEIKTNSSLNATHDAAVMEAQRRGLAGDAAQGFVAQFTSPVVATTLDALVKQGAAPQAKAYLEANKNLMTAQDYERATQQTTKGLDVGAGMDAADKVIQGLTQPDGSFSLEDGLAQLRQQRQSGAISTEVYQNAEQELKDRYSVHRVQVEANTSTNEDATWGVFNQTRSLSAVQLNPAFAKLPQQKQNQILQQMKAQLQENQNDPNVLAAHRQAYWELTTDPNFLQMSDSDIRAKQGVLGPQMTVEAMDQKHKMLASPIKVQQVHIDQDQVASELRAAGLLPADGKIDDAGKIMLSDLTYQLKQAQQASGQEWSLDNTKKLLQPLIQKVVVDKHWWGGDITAPAYKLRMQGVQVPAQFASDLEETNKQQWLKANGSLKGYQPLTLPQLYQSFYNAKQKGIIDGNGNYKTKTSLAVNQPTMMRGH